MTTFVPRARSRAAWQPLGSSGATTSPASQIAIAMNDASEAERLAFITHAQVAVVLEEAEIAELEARAFGQDRARQ